MITLFLLHLFYILGYVLYAIEFPELIKDDVTTEALREWFELHSFPYLKVTAFSTTADMH